MPHAARTVLTVPSLLCGVLPYPMNTMARNAVTVGEASTGPLRTFANKMREKGTVQRASGAKIVARLVLRVVRPGVRPCDGERR